MATLNIVFKPLLQQREVKEGMLYYQVIHRGQLRTLSTGIKVLDEEWDAGLMSVVEHSERRDEQRSSYLAQASQSLKQNYRRLEQLCSRLESSGGSFSVDDLVHLYMANDPQAGFLSYADELVARLQQMGKVSTVNTYTTAVNSFKRFRKDEDIALDDMDSDLLEAYEHYLRTQGLCPNSTSFYMRNLRAIYNRAVEQHLTWQRHPFRHVYTGIDKTVKRAVSLQVIRNIQQMDLKDSPSMDYARDLFMFSFFTRGMSFVDMAYLEKGNLRNGMLTYRRRKTSQLLSVKWEPPMQAIVDKYDTAATPYLLPIIKDGQGDLRKQYKTEAHRVNAHLKKLGAALGLTVPLTSYVARHSWASIARCSNIALSTISAAMGHDSESTTQIYLASLDTSAVDQANSLILDLLDKKGKKNRK